MQTTSKLTEHTTKTLTETSKKVAAAVDHVKASPGGIASWGGATEAKTAARKPAVPKPDDFFADVDDAFAAPVKGQTAAKQQTAAAFDDDFDFPAPAKPVGSKRAGGIEAAGSNDPQRAAAEDGSRAAAAPPGDNDPQPSTPAAGDMSAAADGWGDDSPGDGWGDLDLDSLAKKLDISEAMAASDAELAPAPALAQAAGNAGADAPDAQETGSGSAGQEQAGDSDRSAHPAHEAASEAASEATSVPAPAAAGEDGEPGARRGEDDVGQGGAAAGGAAGGMHGCAQCKGREASLKGATARMTRLADEKEGLKVKVLELEKANAQMQEALARKGTQLQRAVETQERLEVTIEEQRVQMDALQGELKTLHSANSQAAEMARYVCILGARL